MSADKTDEKNIPQLFSLRPAYETKFKPSEAKKIIREVLHKKLKDMDTVDNGKNIVKKISAEVRKQLASLPYKRYKYVVNTMIGEQKGEGLKMGARCFWDPDTDDLVSEIYMTKKIFGVCTVMAVYLC